MTSVYYKTLIFFLVRIVEVLSGIFYLHSNLINKSVRSITVKNHLARV